MSSLAELNKKLKCFVIPLHNLNCQVSNCDFDSAADAGQLLSDNRVIYNKDITFSSTC